MRTPSVLVASLLLLLAAVPVVAQDPAEGLTPLPFSLAGRLQPGERWATCGGLRFRATSEGRPSLEASIAWTHSVLVVARPDGFALQGTLTSLVWEERRDGVLSVRAWDPAGPGPFERAEARTWTFALEPDWTLVDVDGPEASIQVLLDRLRPDPADAVTAELERRVARRAADGLERFLVASSDHLGQPVRKAMASLATGPLLPGRAWALEPRHGPAGRSRFLGLEGVAGHFQAAWEVTGERTLEARFVIDPRGRLRWMNVQDTEVVPLEGAPVRAVCELAFGIVRVEGEEPAWTPTLLAR